MQNSTKTLGFLNSDLLVLLNEECGACRLESD